MTVKSVFPRTAPFVSSIVATTPTTVMVVNHVSGISLLTCFLVSVMPMNLRVHSLEHDVGQLSTM